MAAVRAGRTPDGPATPHPAANAGRAGLTSTAAAVRGNRGWRWVPCGGFAPALCPAAGSAMILATSAPLTGFEK
jgi:hypothetical protein